MSTNNKHMHTYTYTNTHTHTHTCEHASTPDPVTALLIIQRRVTHFLRILFFLILFLTFFFFLFLLIHYRRPVVICVCVFVFFFVKVLCNFEANSLTANIRKRKTSTQQHNNSRSQFFKGLKSFLKHKKLIFSPLKKIALAFLNLI